MSKWVLLMCDDAAAGMLMCWTQECEFGVNNDDVDQALLRVYVVHIQNGYG